MTEKDSCVTIYNTHIEADKFVIVAHGLAEDVRKAKDILATTCADDIAVHSIEKSA